MSAAQPSPVMTDAEVAVLLGIATKTLQSRMRKTVEGDVDMLRAEPKKIGRRRFLVRAKVERVLGIR